MWVFIQTHIISGLVPGIISGLIASLIFALFLLLIKPKVKVASKIARTNGDNEVSIIRVKVVNHTWAMLTNIKYALYYCNVHDDGISNVVEIPPRKSPMSYIARHNSSDDDADYAVRFSYELDNQKYPVGGNKKLLFIFIADHSFSNTTVCIKKEYYDSDIIDGIYQIGDSTKIISNHPES